MSSQNKSQKLENIELNENLKQNLLDTIEKINGLLTEI